MNCSSEATHLWALCEALSRTDGPVLEMGVGNSSTPFLHAVCEQMGRDLLSIESNAEWHARFVRLSSPSHKIVLATDTQACPEFLNWKGSVALIDHYPSIARGRDAASLSGRCEIVVMHDTEPADWSYYDWAPAFAAFKFHKTYAARMPHATLLWN